MTITIEKIANGYLVTNGLNCLRPRHAFKTIEEAFEFIRGRFEPGLSVSVTLGPPTSALSNTAREQFPC